MWAKKCTHKNLQTHINTYGPSRVHTHVNRSTTKPPVLSSPAVSRDVSKAACGAELRRCGEDQLQMGFSLSHRPAHLCCFIRLCYVTYCSSRQTHPFSPSLSLCFIFHGFPVLLSSNWNKRGDAQQKRRVCARCVPWLRATRTSVCVSDHKDNKPNQN